MISMAFWQKLRILGRASQEQNWEKVPFPAHIYEDWSRYSGGDKRPGTTRPVSGEASHFLKDGVLSGQFFNVVSYPEGPWKEHSDIVALPHFITLVMAFDCALEPGLPASNITKSTVGLKAMWRELEKDTYTLNPFSGRGFDLPRLKKALFCEAEDTTDFRGGGLPSPRHFSVTKEDDGYKLWMGIDQRDSVLSQSAVYRAALNSDDFSFYDHQGFSAVKVDEMVNIIREGTPVHTTHCGEWVGVKISTADANSWAHKARRLFSRNLHMTDGHYGVLVCSETELIMTVDRNEYERALVAWNASRGLEKAIYGGNDDADLMREMIRMGADLRYVDADAAEAGVSFASLMKKHDCYKMLSALRDRSGVHDGLNFDAREPEPDVTI